ncbi:GSCOCG00001727001-RA-CDS [Cotesia congregata]|nr:GSCOCG00001727001-RA-CDS [Cotesia congregata]
MENKEEKLTKEKTLLKAVDDLGEGSAFLWTIFVFNILTMILFGLNTMSYIFITEIPEFFCSIPELTKKKWTIEQIKNVSITNECQKYDYNYTQFAELGYDEALQYIANSESNPHVISCPSFTFDESGRSTIINEWDLVCDRSLYRPLTFSIFSFGMTCGSGILGTYADKHGRKSSLIISIILQTIVCPASALVPWFWAFIIFKFLTGVSIGAMYSSAYTILTEVARSKRIKVFAAILDATYSIGTYFVIGMAYALPNWRHLQLAVSSFILPMIILIW